MNQLSIPTKQPRFGPKAATKAWWSGQVQKNPIFRQSRDHFLSSNYSFELNQERLITANLDFQELAGKHNHPPRAPDSEPYWYLPIGGLHYRDFKIWAWLEANQVLGLPISQQAQEWFNFTTTYYFKLEATELLNKWFRPEGRRPLGRRAQHIYNSIPTNTQLIQDIILNIPTGASYCTHLSSLNNTLKDSRYLPVTEEGEVIDPRFIKQYLEERLAEYLALGGLVEIIQRENLEVGDYQLPDAFYWDLWSHLSHLRHEYRLWLLA